MSPSPRIQPKRLQSRLLRQKNRLPPKSHLLPKRLLVSMRSSLLKNRLLLKSPLFRRSLLPKRNPWLKRCPVKLRKLKRFLTSSLLLKKLRLSNPCLMNLPPIPLKNLLLKFQLRSHRPRR
jgi:hypothetical protein